MMVRGYTNISTGRPTFQSRRQHKPSTKFVANIDVIVYDLSSAITQSTISGTRIQQFLAASTLIDDPSFVSFPSIVDHVWNITSVHQDHN